MTNIYFNNLSYQLRPDSPKFFKEEIFSQVYILEPDFYDIYDLIDFIADVTVENYTLKDEGIGVSTEGRYMSGKKLIVRIKLKGKLTYNTENIKYGAKVLFFDFIKNISIVIPKKFKNEYTCDLIRAKRFTINTYIEDLYCRKVDERSVHISSILFLNLKFC